MQKKHLLWQLYCSILIICIGGCFLLGWSVYQSFEVIKSNPSLSGNLQSPVELLSAIEAEFDSVLRKIVWLALFIATSSALVCYWSSQQIQKALSAITNLVKDYSRGELEPIEIVHEQEGFEQLSFALNNMALSLKDRIKSIEEQKSQVDAVLASMSEGVIAIGCDEKVISLNRAAYEILGISNAKAEGKFIQELVFSSDFERFVQTALKSDSELENDFLIHARGDVKIRVHASQLKDSKENLIGAILVVSDVSRIRHLENVRTDFVANVSHELKTPVTAIKGFVETLLAGAMQDPEDAKRFLKIVLSQANRLNAIIEDLLSLSRLEESQESEKIDLQEGDLAEVVDSAVTSCVPKAKEKEIVINYQDDSNAKAKINQNLLEQAVVNLIDNAIKYSQPGTTIDVVVKKQGEQTSISVQDDGPGIPDRHLARLFERFYRVDPGRSREVGGTGLGLAIVKHIAQVHGGTATAQSRLGQGSTFTINVPNSNI